MKAKRTFLTLNRLFPNRRENAIFDHSYRSYNEETPSIKLSIVTTFLTNPKEVQCKPRETLHTYY